MKWQVRLKKLFELKKRKLDRIPIADNNWDFLFISHQGPWYEEYRKFKESHTRPDRLVTSLFNSPDYIRKNVNPDELMWGLYWIASDLQHVEIEVSLYDVFQQDELFDLWHVCNLSLIHI